MASSKTTAFVRRKIDSKTLVFICVASACIAMSFTIEYAQIHLPSRTPSQLDPLGNTLGGCIAAIIAIRLNSGMVRRSRSTGNGINFKVAISPKQAILILSLDKGRNTINTMKAIIAILSVALLHSPVIIGDETEVNPAYDYNLTGHGVNLEFKVVRDPIFPVSLQNKGVSWGHVIIQVDIDYTGELRDWLVTEASHKDFAEAVEHVIGQWKFAPPIWKGKPISVIGAIEITFRSQGNVISLDITSGISDLMMNNSRLRSHDRIEIVNFDDLDTFPERIKTVDPIVPKKLIEKHNNSIGVFSFYIDTEGHVRLPHINRVEGKVDIRLLEAAQDALEQWRFEPPTSKGRKVIVEVSQPFKFTKNGS